MAEEYHPQPNQAHSSETPLRMTEGDLKKPHPPHLPHSPRRAWFAPRYQTTDRRPLYQITDRRRTLSTFIVMLLVLAGITALIVWLVYRPKEPKFRVVNLAVYDLNLTSPPYMSTTMQFTLVTRNPNDRVSLYYDQLTAFVTYRNQAITPTADLPPFYHEEKSTVALSPMLGGGSVPVPADVANGLMTDLSYGVVNLKLILMGKVRYKGGAIRTRHYGIYVNCDVFAELKRGVTGQVPLLGASECQVDA